MAHGTAGSLGVYQPTSNDCSDGGDYRCGPKGGVISCRPCGFTQKDAFEFLQAQTNRILTSKSITLPPHFRDGDDRSLLWVDARIGPKTTAAVGLAAVVAEIIEKPPEVLLVALVPAVRDPKNMEAMSLIAAHAIEIGVYFKTIADKIGAATPGSGSPTEAEQGLQPEDGSIQEITKDKAHTWLWILGAVAVAGAAGGVGYYFWKRSRTREVRKIETA
jgi:hypothetical protein